MQTFLNARKLLSGHTKNLGTLHLLGSVKFSLVRKRNLKCGINVYNSLLEIASRFGEIGKNLRGPLF